MGSLSIEGVREVIAKKQAGGSFLLKRTQMLMYRMDIKGKKNKKGSEQRISLHTTIGKFGVSPRDTPDKDLSPISFGINRVSRVNPRVTESLESSLSNQVLGSQDSRRRGDMGEGDLIHEILKIALETLITSSPSGKLLLKVAMTNAKVSKDRDMVREFRSPIGKGPSEVNAWLEVKEQGGEAASIDATQTGKGVMDAMSGLTLRELNRGGKGIMPRSEGRISNMNTSAPGGGREVNIKGVMRKVEIARGKPNSTPMRGNDRADISKKSSLLVNGPLRRDMKIDKDENQS